VKDWIAHYDGRTLTKSVPRPRAQQLVLVAVESELAIHSPAADIDGAVLHHDCRDGGCEQPCKPYYICQPHFYQF